MRALDGAVTAGKILYVGLSDAPAWVLARANTLANWRGWTPFSPLQVRYNLAHRYAERELIPAAEAVGVSVAAWGPLAGGLRSGKFSQSVPAEHGTRVDGSSLGDRQRAVATAVTDVARELAVTPAQVAIAWTMARSHIVHPILGARRPEQLADDLGALEVTLPDETRQRLEAATGFDAGFPSNVIAETKGFVYGPVGKLLDGRQ